LQEDRAILILGQLQKDEKSVKLMADEIIPMEKAEEYWSASVHIRLEGNRMDKDLLMQLQDLLLQHPGTCKGTLHLIHADGAEVVIELPENLQLKAGPRLRREVNTLLGYKAVETYCAPISPKTNSNGAARNRGNGKKPRW
jgi:DNA polymerase-3 subunit alpha